MDNKLMDYDALLSTTRDAYGIIENVLDLEFKLRQLGLYAPKPFEREVRRVLKLLHRYNLEEFAQSRRGIVRVYEREWYFVAYVIITSFVAFCIVKTQSLLYL